MPDHRTSRPLRFVLVGLVNTAFSYSLYALLVWLGVHFAVANLGATVAGILFSFRTQGRWVFGDTRWGRLRRFVPAWALLYLFNVAVIAVLVRFGLDAYTAGALALVPTVAASYLVQKHYVFAARPQESR